MYQFYFFAVNLQVQAQRKQTMLFNEPTFLAVYYQVSRLLMHSHLYLGLYLLNDVCLLDKGRSSVFVRIHHWELQGMAATGYVGAEFRFTGRQLPSPPMQCGVYQHDARCCV
jgi:hypothetical protein